MMMTRRNNLDYADEVARGWKAPGDGTETGGYKTSKKTHMVSCAGVCMGPLLRYSNHAGDSNGLVLDNLGRPSAVRNSTRRFGRPVNSQKPRSVCARRCRS
jgi:hypothetical protein